VARILWISDGGAHTGFARVTHAIGERLVTDYGHDIHVLAANYRGDFWPGLRDPNVQPLKLYPTTGPLTTTGKDLYGASRILELLGKIEPEIVIMLNDPQALLNLFLRNTMDPGRVLLTYRPIIWYAPCDGTNLPSDWTTILPNVTDVIGMSQWSVSHYSGELAYHGIDPDEWWPVEERPITTSTGVTLKTKADCKKAFGYDAADFLIGRVDTNSGRKDFAATWKALVPVMRRHKHVKAHFHCSNRSNPAINFDSMLSRDLVTADRFYTPGLKNDFEGWPQQDMNALVNAFDLVVSTSRGEGFGFSNAEALACGVPVIAQNVSAIPEVVGPGGVLLEPQRLLTVPSGEDQWLADIDAFTDAVLDLYNSPTRRRDLGRKGVEHVRQNFQWDKTTGIFDSHIRSNIERYEAFVAAQASEPGSSDEEVTE
jgi:glycosyltransferase involved in cell wall biosynthesis